MLIGKIELSNSKTYITSNVVLVVEAAEEDHGENRAVSPGHTETLKNDLVESRGSAASEEAIKLDEEVNVNVLREETLTVRVLLATTGLKIDTLKI